MFWECLGQKRITPYKHSFKIKCYICSLYYTLKHHRYLWVSVHLSQECSLLSTHVEPVYSTTQLRSHSRGEAKLTCTIRPDVFVECVYDDICVSRKSLRPVRKLTVKRRACLLSRGRWFSDTESNNNPQTDEDESVSLSLCRPPRASGDLTYKEQQSATDPAFNRSQSKWKHHAFSVC